MISFFKSVTHLKTPLNKEKVSSLLRENIILRQGDLNRNTDNERYYFSGIIDQDSFELRTISQRRYKSPSIILVGKITDHNNSAIVTLTIKVNTLAYIFFAIWFLIAGLISIIALYNLILVNFIKAILPLSFMLIVFFIVQNEFRINSKKAIMELSKIIKTKII